jgi:hypothetical protein
MGDRQIFLKTSSPLSLMTTYQMSLISAGSISLDSTFKPWTAQINKRKKENQGLIKPGFDPNFIK